MTLRDKLKFWLALNNYIEMIVHNTSLLSLPNAMEDSLDYLKALGGTEITPKVYFDSITANGGCEQRNLPAEYTQINYVTNIAQTMINTGVKFDFSKNYEIELKASGVTGSWYILQARENISAPISGISGSSTGNAIGLNFNGTYVAASQISRMVGHIYYVKGIINNGNMTLYVKDETAGTEETVTGTYTVITGQSVDIGLFGNAAGNYVAIDSNVYFARIKEDDNYIMDYVPCRQGTTVGFYDKVSGTFKTTTGLSAGTDIVPTPDNPVDIYCNNGVLKARHQSGLPLGYTLMEYIESSGSQYIDTGVYISTGYKVRVKAYATSIPTTIAFFGCTSTADATNAKKGIFRIIGASINRCAWGNGNGSIVGYLTGNDSINTWYDMVCDNGVWTINDTLFATCSESSFTSEYSMWLFARNTGGTVGLPASCRISVCQIWDNNGQMIRNFVPAKNSSNVVGMYDLVNGVFYQNAGTGDFVAGDPVSDPVEIYTDGTVETINVHGKNLYNPATRTDGYYIGANGVIAQGSGTFCYSALIPVKPNTDYILSGIAGQSDYRRLHAYDSNGNWISQISFASTTTGNTYNITGITPNDCFYVRISIPMLDTNVQIEEGSTATLYEPYFDGGSATTEMLLSVGDYKDTQEVLSGNVTRNVGIKVLDGTEGWVRNETNIYCLGSDDIHLFENPTTAISTHFIGVALENVNMPDNSVKFHKSSYFPSMGVVFIKDTAVGNVTNFKQYLAEQYANGTPVIIVYPLATSTTESVSSQPLTYIDNYTLTIEDASISNPIVNVMNSTHTIPTPDKPLDITCNNGVLKLSPNLYNPATAVDAYLTDTGGLTPSAQGKTSVFIPVKSSTKYTLKLLRTAAEIYTRVCSYDSNENFISLLVKDTDVTAGYKTNTFTTDVNAKYIKISFKSDSTEVQLEENPTATTYHPYGTIYADDTVEMINVHGKNLLNRSAVGIKANAYISQTGSFIPDNAWSISDYIPVDGNTFITYSTTRTSSGLGAGNYMAFYDIDKNFISTSVQGAATFRTVQTPANAKYVRVSFLNNIQYDWQLEEGDTVTAYEPYFDGGTATAEMLLKVGTYQDVQSIISGAVTRNIGVKVLDGTEAWVLDGVFFYTDIASLGINHTLGVTSICTHYKSVNNQISLTDVNYNAIRVGYYNSAYLAYNYLYIKDLNITTVAQLKQFLADQYAAGTPVIVVYPLATPTTESVSGQALQVTEGNNIAEITQAGLDNLELEAKYNSVP